MCCNFFNKQSYLYTCQKHGETLSPVWKRAYVKYSWFFVGFFFLSDCMGTTFCPHLFSAGLRFSLHVKSIDSNESAGRQHKKIKSYAQVQQHSLLAGV